jgi:hypothetical protein
MIRTFAPSKSLLITVSLPHEEARAAERLASAAFVLASRSLLRASVIHSGKAAAAYRAIDTIDRRWNHERSNFDYVGSP